MTTFLERFKQELGDRGYESSIRRSVQAVVLYEAKRCVASRLAAMRPFQRRVALYDQVKALSTALGLLPHQQEEILWRTGTSKEPIDSDLAWKRVKLIERDISNLRAKIKPFCQEGMAHDEIMDKYIQHIYEQNHGKSTPFPPQFPHAHSQVLMTYRMYYDGYELDTTFPPAVPFKEIVVPANRPTAHAAGPGILVRVNPGQAQQNIMDDEIPREIAMDSDRPSGDYPQTPMNTRAATMESADSRLEVLKEIRMHMDLLNDFVGVIPQNFLNRRKRDLYHALPRPPPRTTQRVTPLDTPASKRQRVDMDDVVDLDEDASIVV
eukprot:Nitzschia sp. Nitz4//scaffold180_size44305//19578//20627//NITZ4_007238-RA/size44305-processed-gene-0.10-mRNA-1//1//CDS//3329539464//2554//frame0